MFFCFCVHDVHVAASCWTDWNSCHTVNTCTISLPRGLSRVDLYVHTDWTPCSSIDSVMFLMYRDGLAELLEHYGIISKIFAGDEKLDVSKLRFNSRLGKWLAAICLSGHCSVLVLKMGHGTAVDYFPPGLQLHQQPCATWWIETPWVWTVCLRLVTRQRRDCDLGTERRFSSKSQHMNIHTAKHRCTDCGKCCRSGSELAVDMRSHSGEKPFECRPTVCSKRFAQVALWITEEFTVERNRTNDTCVTRRLLGLDI